MLHKVITTIIDSYLRMVLMHLKLSQMIMSTSGRVQQDMPLVILLLVVLVRLTLVLVILDLVLYSPLVRLSLIHI